ncbi:formate/nitrite transporter [Natranaerovirga hydrolytica]|uniref:Formate/nitrite transporter n=1 Tax=Natranaerovirga hydrolytica TaxID=680378 RepID=A0A4R1MS02_9FIRM|nr:formate/nitrite transporter family protein [Natranaerovirga hydrolytica]TCK92693.1 formate/nitrite transporter [Natranaerovirga hydrolytica]
MKKGYSGPKALTDYILKQSRNKANKSFMILLVQGILAGMYVSLGAIGYFKIAANTIDPGLGSFLGALVFPLGIIAILLMQAELFTSDSMVMIAVYDKKTKFVKTLRILSLVIFANMIGAMFIAFMTQASGIFNEQVMGMVMEKSIQKVNLPIDQLLISGIMCNILVSTGVCLSYSCKDEIAKIIVVWFAITVFVLTGTEHVVANMYYLFTAYFAGAQISLAQIFYNLSIVAVGNFIGGGIIVSGINYVLAYKNNEKPEPIQMVEPKVNIL